MRLQWFRRRPIAPPRRSVEPVTGVSFPTSPKLGSDAYWAQRARAEAAELERIEEQVQRWRFDA